MQGDGGRWTAFAGTSSHLGVVERDRGMGMGQKKCAGKADLGGGSESGDIFCSLWGFCQIMISWIVWEYRKEKRGIRMHYNDSSSQYSMQDFTDIILHPGGSSSVDSEVYLRSVSLENSLIELTSADSALKFNKCWFHKKCPLHHTHIHTQRHHYRREALHLPCLDCYQSFHQTKKDMLQQQINAGLYPEVLLN